MGICPNLKKFTILEAYKKSFVDELGEEKMLYCKYGVLYGYVVV